MLLLLICFICCIFYALEVTVVDKKLGKADPMTLTFWSGVGIVVISGIILFSRSGLEGFSIGETNVWWLILAILLFFCADYTHFLALHRGAGGILLSTTYLLIPVICSLLILKAPSVKMILAWILGFITLVLLFSEKSD